MRSLPLSSGWHVLQDVHNVGEKLAIYNVARFDATAPGAGLSEWEPIDRLEHLQLLFSANPYWGRELRHYNAAPWWYRNDFIVDDPTDFARLTFTNIDYFCRVWLNGVQIAEHEGYSTPLTVEVGEYLRAGHNALVVKVWSPWDDEVADPTPVKRTLRVQRDMAKGTYEHDDTLVPRDVNPIGIYGTVQLDLLTGPTLVEVQSVATIEHDGTGVLRVSGQWIADSAQTQSVQLRVREAESGALVATWDGSAAGELAAELRIPDALTWSTWDHGLPSRYTLESVVDDETTSHGCVAFRTVELRRTPEETSYRINGRPFFVRGTSYLPDAYLSTVTRARYLRDLLGIRTAGFNTVRVHVHVELPEFYDLCDELGLAVIQDTDYNWNHPADDAWRERFLAIVHDQVRMLEQHPCIITWVALNEPGNSAADDEGRDRAMSISPGPQLFSALQKWDPTRPIIKGSWAEHDLDSGDSHNYTGSLWAPDIPYTDIDGTTEKFNTEFGFDAPSSWIELRRHPEIAQRLKSIGGSIEELQEYQYRLVKYYTDHYRSARDAPTSGYVHFMYIDLAPQSFYGVVSHAGVPKRGYEALLESNQPVSVFLERTRDSVHRVLLANDHPWPLGPTHVTWGFVDETGLVIEEGERELDVRENSLTEVTPVGLKAADFEHKVHVTLTVSSGDERRLATNTYRDVFTHPAHPEGHPDRMSHEFGVRLFGAADVYPPVGAHQPQGSIR